jgi:hypothetical protein
LRFRQTNPEGILLYARRKGRMSALATSSLSVRAIAFSNMSNNNAVDELKPWWACKNEPIDGSEIGWFWCAANHNENCKRRGTKYMHTGAWATIANKDLNGIWPQSQN